MNKRKDFSIVKWIIFPLNSIVLAAIIAWFNLSVFGWEDGLPYTAVVALIGVFSVLINRYTESDNRTLARAAFVFEIVLTAALIINAAYSISVQRKMSVARMGETSQKETITEIGKLRGGRTQREALRKLETRESAQSIFADVERVLFWIMICELGLYAISAFSLFAIAKLMTEPTLAERYAEEFPESLELENRLPIKREKFSQKKDTAKTYMSFDPAGLARLRETLRDISFRLHGVSFKTTVNQDHIWIRAMRANRGTQETTHSVKAKMSILDDAVSMPRDQFRERLEKFLKASGFEI